MAGENEVASPFETAREKSWTAGGLSGIALETLDSSPPARGLTVRALLRKAFSFPVFLGALLAAGCSQSFSGSGPVEEEAFGT